MMMRTVSKSWFLMSSFRSDEQLSLAIGRRGQNVRLASQLSGWAIDILTEEQESERRQKEFAERSALFMEAMDVDEVIAQLLVSEGFRTLEEVAYVEQDEITAIEGFDADTAEELQTRAREYLQELAEKQDARRRELGVADEVLDIPGVTLPMVVIFGENDILSVEDVAGLVPDDLRGYTEMKDGERVHEEGLLESFKLSEAMATDMIMQARVQAGWIDASELEVAEEEIKDEVATDGEAPALSGSALADEVFGG